MFSATFVLAAALGCSPDTTLTADYPSMAVIPNTVEFYDDARERAGTVVGETATVTLSIANAGDAPLEIQGISLANGEPAFAITALEVDEVGEDESEDLIVSFTPTDFAIYGDTIVIDTNDPDFPDGYTIPLTGEGVDFPRPCIEVDPPELDFGDVEPGDYGFDFITITNCGEDDLNISQVAQTGSGAFSRVSADPVGVVLAPGGTDAASVNFYYEPTTGLGDSGAYVIYSDALGTPELEIPLIGNGGGGAVYPEAVIDCPSSASVLETISLSGEDSTDPAGGDIIAYIWSLEKSPDGSQSSLSATDAVETSVLLDSAGEFVVTLQVVNDAGTLSAPTECRMDAVPQNAIHIELTWNTGDADMDLHLANRLPDEPGENFFLRGEDVNWCATSEDWGNAGDPVDDGILEQDTQDGYGPENISIYEPVEGEYLARVHYYDTDSFSESTATVRFYLDGALFLERERIMERNDVWDVGYVRWPSAVVVAEDEDEQSPLYDAPTRECYTGE